MGTASSVSIEIKPEKLGNDPAIQTYHVTLSNGSGIWTERYTKSELPVFLRGLEAAGSMLGARIEIPEIPR
ncbi:hypothetical protein KW797_03690 [Candidatus Parcubacteria bacterium]|nr:hypothetical protein [Candidatus Parcubacteria bacterium]